MGKARAVLDHALDVADRVEGDFLGDVVLVLGLVEEALVLGGVTFDVLERPDLLGLGVLDEIDDGGRASADLGEDAVAGELCSRFCWLVVLH